MEITFLFRTQFLALFLVFMDCWGLGIAQFCDLRVAAPLYAYDIVLLALLGWDFQCPLEQFTAECDAVESLDQVEEVRYLGGLFMNIVKKDCEIYCRLGALAAVMQALYQPLSSKDRAEP